MGVDSKLHYTCVLNCECTICPGLLSLLKDNKEQSGLYDDDDEEDEEPGMSLHSGLSTMRLMLGANDRRIYAQRFGQAHYDMALQREKQRMVSVCANPHVDVCTVRMCEYNYNSVCI